MMHFWATIKQQKDKSYLVEFPGLEGCLTEGRSLAEALAHAKEAVDGWLAVRCDNDFNIPKSIKPKGRNVYSIDVSLTVAFAIRLRKLRVKRGLSQAEVAKRLDISQQAYAKLETPLKTNPSLQTIERISVALDADIDLLLAA
jgi:predicted RNase H-like HicB family nuclease/DNA-binding Xre family transcriptional regulator